MSLTAFIIAALRYWYPFIWAGTPNLHIISVTIISMSVQLEAIAFLATDFITEQRVSASKGFDM